MRTRFATVIVLMPDATNVNTVRGAAISMSERNSQHRWSSQCEEIEDKSMRKLHGRTAKVKSKWTSEAKSVGISPGDGC